MGPAALAQRVSLSRLPACRRHGTERADVNAVDAGEYRVKVVAFERPDAKAGTFTVTLADVRDLTAEEVANAPSEKEILAIEDEWERAVDTADVATLSRILHDDGFQLAPVASATRTRQQLIAGWQESAKARAKGTTQEHTLSELVGDHFYPFGRVPREKQTPVKVEPAVLAAYAGTYRPENGTNTVTMAVENDSLMAQWTVPGQPSFPNTPLEAVSATSWSLCERRTVACASSSSCGTDLPPVR
ncbi:MAG: hypothetical protein H0V80_11680 [Acidobacteria bacterium]|nr:hypothetical protein [Acidobacteriota bacterium]